jgi:hypothetical protein
MTDCVGFAHIFTYSQDPSTQGGVRSTVTLRSEDVIVVISLAIEVICAVGIVQILFYFAGHVLPTGGSGASLISIMTPVAARGQASELAVFLRHTLTLLIIGGQR